MNEPRYASYPSLMDRVVLVTGGGSGIGASIVAHFAQQGSKVAFFDRSEECSLELVDSLSGKTHRPPFFLRCDVTDAAALRKAIGQVQEQVGTPTVLVNNAANDDRHQFLEVTPEYWD